MSSPVVNSDNAWSYEIGAKGGALDGLIDFDLAGWYTTYSEFQAPLTVTGVGLLQNSMDGLKAIGFDAALTLNPIDNFRVSTNVGFASSELNSDEPGFGGIGGVQVPNIPKWKASVQWNYTHPISSSWTADFGGGVRYTSAFDSAFSFSTTVADRIEERVITDLNIGLGNEKVRLGLYVTNLFDERKLTTRTDQIVGLDPMTMAPIFNSTGVFERPRTFGGNVTVNF